MALPVNTQLKYWAIAAVVFGLILWFLGQTLTPFILGGVVAYCMDPIADKLQRIGFSRIIATTIITLTAGLIFFVVVLLVLPTLVEQAFALFNAFPQIVTELREYLTARFPDLLDGNSQMRQSLIKLGDTVSTWGGSFVSALVTSVSSIVNIAVLIVIVPVVSFYLLMDWDNLVAKIDELVPRDHVSAVRQIASEIDQTLASFIRGQGTVVSILSVYYAVALMGVGLNYGIVVGAIAGLISFIPYIGALVGGALAIGLALFQFWGEWFWVGAVVIVFMIGQVLEGNFLTPKLVGDSVGLHPVWLIFALSVFGSLFGFVGMLVAVPVAAMLGVVARFMITQYKSGLLYRGRD